MTSMTSIRTKLRHHLIFDSPSAVFESLTGFGRHEPNTVYNSLEVAARVFEDHAANLRGLATAAAEGDDTEGPLHMLASMALQFEKQAQEADAVLAFLRGDNEPDGEQS